MNEITPIPFSPSSQDNEIILYQPDSTVKLEVRLENETVWLTQQQIADLFGTKRPAITKHLANIYKSGELEENSTCSILEHMGNDGTQRYTTKYYNLDAILSVGYRVNSKNATLFRQWANKVLKEYLLRGYSINQRLMYMENRIDHRLSEHDIQIKELSNRMDFFVRTSLPPKEGIIYEGQIFDAYTLISDLVRKADTRIILIDNYVDDRVLKTLDKRKDGVSATIFTNPRNSQINLDIKKHNAQYPAINLRHCTNVHDRFLIIDETVYFIGGSIKDLGKKIVAFSQMHQSPDDILSKIR
ncbi:MAG: DNA-binding protein [Bacteroidales bacterium]|nr:DNA-binding protein [Bacteroidales bacterium]MBD5223143.1 DNA-binding protein [Bacteroidales bacterium]